MDDRLKLGVWTSLESGIRVARRALLTSAADPAHPQISLVAEQHMGDPQQRIDADVHDAIESKLTKFFPAVRMIGEEVLRTVTPHLYPVAVVDSLDGTLPHSALGFGWGTSLMLLMPTRGGHQLAAAAVANSSGYAAALWDEQSVSETLLGEKNAPEVVLGDCRPSTTDTMRVACVGAKKGDAATFGALREALRDAVVFNVGGNPAGLNVLRGGLDAIVSFKPQACWDAVSSLLVAYAGGVVGAVDECKVFPRSEFLSTFRQVVRGGIRKVVPPHIAARDREVYLAIQQALAANSSATARR